MTKEALSEAEATRLFNSVSGVLDDPNKLNDLLVGPVPVEKLPEETSASTPEPSEEKEEDTPTAPPQEVEPQSSSSATSAPVEKKDPAAELEALRHRFAELEHRKKSDDGRVSAFQRKINELEDKLAALNSSYKSEQNKPAATPASTADESSEVEVQQAMAELKRVDPALHKIMVAQAQVHKRELDQLRSTISTELAPVRQTMSSFENEREKERLVSTIPNIAEVVRSQQFQEYKEVAPRVVREWLNSKRADDVIEGMRAYHLYLQTNGLIPTTPSKPPEEPQPVGSAASPVISERERKLSTSVSVSSPTAPVRKELSEEALFAELYNQLRKEHQAK